MKKEKKLRNPLAVIYANEGNIWDDIKHRFHFGKNFDEMSYAIPLEKAENLVKEINEEGAKEGRPEVYLIEITALIP